MAKLKKVLIFMVCGMILCSMVSISALAAIPNDAKEFNGHFYMVYDIPANWRSSEELCESMGGHLVSITSYDENEFVKSLMTKGHSYWTGGYKVGNEFVWVDTGEPFSYTNWSKGQPDDSANEKQFYVRIYGANHPYYGEWDDYEDSTLCMDGFICEWEQEQQEIPPVVSSKCSCNCHKGGFSGFIWKIGNFFHRIFGMDKYRACPCGEKMHW